ncbi:NADH-quinone oxidoreductase subunit L [Brevifollis gellanilyticus]|uniref:NADH-quinone oxidoreductase subunit L n=1 Tax=Brevifollis gellanilyticus TaxID=748831 RepID=A0A512MBB3_9BACT|nr:NADH-quinone oxidoreductase subunit L [Brevifollis gellanilyticus]GEP44023.1 NADH-quinone oxidoreductase subunit L [Brevifollis gellanilyticus]
MPHPPQEITSSSLPTLLLLLPLFSALVILLAHRVLKGACVAISIFSAAICFVISLMLLGTKDAAPLLLPFIEVGKFHIAIDAVMDHQSRGMMFIVTSIGFFVHLFSVGYMKEDESKERFFGSLSLFMFSMTGIVLSGNLFMMFIFWELVGLSSYLLIGHWFEKPSAAEASKKAFLTNRIGDFGFMIGILMLFMANHGDVSFAGLHASFAEGPLHDSAKLHPTFMMLAALGIFMGAVGKSAQFPLHVWLPDAMEGPTPVSALIHAATMVAAGVYMLVRCAFVIEASPDASYIIAWIGGLTALMAALIATQQNDIKRVLAYSTLSQLGYMVMAVGLVALQAGGSHHDAAAPGHPAMFHLYTHAFFKAMLFLGSGAVIYACHHEQDIWKMGGLAKHMPVVFITFAIGTASLMGVPYITSGFWSKEAILGVAFEVKGGSPLLWIGVATAMLTAFYMTRMFIVAFFGKPRSENASHAVEAPIIMILPLALLALLTILSPWDGAARILEAMKPHHAAPHHTVEIASILALLIGSGAGYVIYKGKNSDPLASNPLAKLFANKFYFDELYTVLVKVFQDGLAWIITGIERILVDGIVARLPAFVARRFGHSARALAGGHLQGYTFLLGAGLLVVIYLIVFVLPQAGH